MQVNRISLFWNSSMFTHTFNSKFLLSKLRSPVSHSVYKLSLTGMSMQCTSSLFKPLSLKNTTAKVDNHYPAAIHWGAPVTVWGKLAQFCFFERWVTCYLYTATSTRKLIFCSSCFAFLLTKQILYNLGTCSCAPLTYSSSGGEGLILSCHFLEVTSHH